MSLRHWGGVGVFLLFCLFLAPLPPPLSFFPGMLLLSLVLVTGES